MVKKVPGTKTDHIILVHGIRDPNFWSDTLKKHFESDGTTKVSPIKVEVVDLISFVFPLTFLRNRFIRQYRDKITNEMQRFRDRRTIIIAHSFGTYAVAHILNDSPYITIDKLIMCGAVVPKVFPWERILKANFPRPSESDAQGKMDGPILNDFSARDVWPLLARFCSFGYGDVGATGCGSPVVDRQHWIKHSDYLQLRFVEKYWEPFIKSGRIVTPGATGDGPLKSRFFFLARWPRFVNLMGISISFLFATLASLLMYKWSEQPIVKASISYNKFNISADDYVVPAGKTTENLEPTIRIFGDDEKNKVPAHIYTREKDAAYDYSAISETDVSKLTIIVRNRPAILECFDIAGTEESGNKPDVTDLYTKYTISYERDHWYNNVMNANWFGVAEFEMAYNYPQNRNSTNTKSIPDNLDIVAKQGILTGSMNVHVKRDADDCIDAANPEKLVTKHYPQQSKHWAFLQWISDAWADAVENTRPVDIAGVKGALESTDEKTRAQTLDSISSNPNTYRNFLDAAFSKKITLNDDRLADLLRGLSVGGNYTVGARSDAVVDLLSLLAHPNAAVRDAARSLIRSPNVAVEETIRSARNYVTKNRIILTSERVGTHGYTKLYLMLIGIRDMYYNLALRTFESALDGDSKSLQQAVESSAALFDEGATLEKIAQAEVRAPLAKNVYGKALVLFRYARIRDVLQNDPKLDYAGVSAAIANKIRNTGKMIAKDNPYAKNAIESFASFLEHSKSSQGEQVYLYKNSNHLTVAARGMV